MCTDCKQLGKWYCDVNTSSILQWYCVLILFCTVTVCYEGDVLLYVPELMQ